MEITRHRQRSAALKIPSEIAVHVFKLSALTGLFTLDFKGTLDWKILQKLSHVCADWRLLVTQTAHLWMKLSYFWTANTAKQVEMIRVHLHRSQNLPLSLSLRYGPRGYGSALNRQPIFDTIVPLFSRLKEFAFTGVIFEDLSQLGSISRSHSLPLLESLQLSHLGFCDEEGLPEPFGRVKLVTPTLRKVDLREIPLDFFSVTLKQATSLSLADSEYTGTAVKKAFASAVHAEKMDITLRAWKKQNVRRKNVPSPKDFLALKSLQLMVTCLEEEIQDEEDNERFDISPVWQSFTAPNLETLAIEGFVGWNQQTFVQFAARSLSNLRTLDISIYGVPAAGWGDIFTHCHSLEAFCTDLKYQDVNAILRGLIIGSSSSRPKLPLLNKLRVVGKNEVASYAGISPFLKERWTEAVAGGRTHGLVRRSEHVEIESLQWYWNDADFNLLATEVQQYRQEGLNIRLERR